MAGLSKCSFSAKIVSSNLKKLYTRSLDIPKDRANEKPSEKPIDNSLCLFKNDASQSYPTFPVSLQNGWSTFGCSTNGYAMQRTSSLVVAKPNFWSFII